MKPAQRQSPAYGRPVAAYRLPASAYWILITGPVDAEDDDAKSPTLHSYGDGAAIVKKPVAVYVEKVYELSDFSALGIGV